MRLRHVLPPLLALVVACAPAPAAVAPDQPTASVSESSPTPPARASQPPNEPPAESSPPPEPSASISPEPSPTPEPQLTPRVERALQRALDTYLAEASIPGLSATILLPDGTEWSGSAGLADVKAGRPVTATTAFPVASISKTFLAALVMDLASEGKLGLDDLVGPILPELKLDAGITIRMLLDHSSGLSDFFLNPKIDRALQSQPARAWTAKRALTFVGRRYFAPGAGWHYSNTNYLVLGLVAERVTGRSLAQQLRERFLDPLGLKGTWYQVAEPARERLAHGYRLTGSAKRLKPVDLADGTGIAPFRSVITAAGGAGSVASTSHDVAAWARALYGGGAIDDESVAIMLASVDRLASYRPVIPYGLGVQAIRVEGHRTFGHSGRFLGFRSAMRYLPDEGISIAVLTNQSRTDLAPLVATFVRILLPPPSPCRCPVAV